MFCFPFRFKFVLPTGFCSCLLHPARLRRPWDRGPWLAATATLSSRHCCWAEQQLGCPSGCACTPLELKWAPRVVALEAQLGSACLAGGAHASTQRRHGGEGLTVLGDDKTWFALWFNLLCFWFVEV